MKKIQNTSEEDGILLSKNEKKRAFSKYVYELIKNANKSIDQGLFDDHFCPACVLETVFKNKPVPTFQIRMCYVDTLLPKMGRYKEYKVGGYNSNGSIDYEFAPIGSFNIERMVNDTDFSSPIKCKFNIEYPFLDAIFEVRGFECSSVGEILSQISAAYKVIFEYAQSTDIRYLHVLDDLVFDSIIRVYANGTIVFTVLS